MALVLVAAVPIAVGVGLLVADDWDDDEMTSQEKKQRRNERLAEHPLNARRVVIGSRPGQHLGITLHGTGREGAYGVRVKLVVVGDLAEQSGLKENDWIISVNGVNVHDHAEAMQLINFAMANGVRLDLQVMSPRTIVIDASRAQHLGVTLRSEPLHRGVLIEALDPQDFLAQHGFRVGDVVTDINGHDMYDHEETLHKLSKKRLFKSKPRVLNVTVMTSGADDRLLKEVPKQDVGSSAPMAFGTPLQETSLVNC